MMKRALLFATALALAPTFALAQQSVPTVPGDQANPTAPIPQMPVTTPDTTTQPSTDTSPATPSPTPAPDVAPPPSVTTPPAATTPTTPAPAITPAPMAPGGDATTPSATPATPTTPGAPATTNTDQSPTTTPTTGAPPTDTAPSMPADAPAMPAPTMGGDEDTTNPPPAQDAAGAQNWYTFTGDLMAQKYAVSDQITPDNVGKLGKAWELHTGDVSDGSGDKPASDWSATPLFVNDTIYVSTPFYRILAVEPDTGKIKWAFDTKSELKGLTQGELKTRGVAYWQAANPVDGQACQKIVYIGTMDARLFAVDADSGKPCTGFGKDGVVDINQWNTTNNKWPLSLLQPPTVYKNELFVGWAGKDWADKVAPPGTVFSLDAQTGALKWTFDTLPPTAYDQTGTSNVWSSMSVDAKNNLLFLPISAPSPDFFGGSRKEDLPYSNSVTALNADTGKVVWSRQLVHHDIWDYDTNSAPVLVDIQKDGKTVPALVQSTKQGLLFVLNRLTGEPIYPIEEKPFPASDVEGEQASPTQPIPSGLEPTVPDQFPGISTLADIASGGYCSRTFNSLRYEGRYTPPSLKGSLAWPATAGGIEWGGGAVDPTTGTYVVNSSEVAQIYQLLTREDYDKKSKEPGAEGYSPQTGAPYGLRLTTFLNPLGMPCWNGPYGTISSYDLATGKLLWRQPFGQVQKWGFYMPTSWGSVTIGSPVITKTGVVFIGASMDSRVRAIDLKTGNVLWQALVDAPAVSEPAVYTYKGREYVLFTVGGNSILEPKVGDQLVAFALPN